MINEEIKRYKAFCKLEDINPNDAKSLNKYFEFCKRTNAEEPKSATKTVENLYKSLEKLIRW